MSYLNNRWNVRNTAGDAGAFQARAGSALTSLISFLGPEIGYIDVNDHVDLLYIGGNGWTVGDLNTSSTAPAAAGVALTNLTNFPYTPGPH